MAYGLALSRQQLGNNQTLTAYISVWNSGTLLQVDMNTKLVQIVASSLSLDVLFSIASEQINVAGMNILLLPTKRFHENALSHRVSEKIASTGRYFQHCCDNSRNFSVATENRHDMIFVLLLNWCCAQFKGPMSIEKLNEQTVFITHHMLLSRLPPDVITNEVRVCEAFTVSY